MSASSCRRDQLLDRLVGEHARLHFVERDVGGAGLGVDDAADARAVDGAGLDGVTADAVWPEFHRKRLGEADDAPFRGGVGRAQREAELAGG